MYIKIHNRKVHYKKIGSGKPIIFVHGWGGNLYSLHSLALLSSKKHCAYLIDLPGFGSSNNPPIHWGIEGYAQLINLFIQKEIKAKTDYFGHSFGGEIGIYLAVHCPTSIDNLILCNSAFKREVKSAKLAKLFNRLSNSQFLPIRKLYSFLKNIYYFLLKNQSDLAKYPHLESNFRKIVTQDMTPIIHRIKNRTLILWGEQDTITPVMLAYELKSKLINSTISIIPENGHNLPLKNPKLVWNEMQKFL